ncbi:MAG: hypothetical protein AcusKO_01840 [Acuticoccus sp.]
MADAEEVVQTAWLRLAGAEGAIANPEAWLTRTVSRLATMRCGRPGGAARSISARGCPSR